jgi:hypothetical protein
MNLYFTHIKDKYTTRRILKKLRKAVDVNDVKKALELVKQYSQATQKNKPV